jgi:uncharacterized protein
MSIETAPALVAPVSQKERIIILDSLRGIAVLGILLMNIPGFGMPYNTIDDPSVLNESGLNYYLWYIFGLGVFEGSQRAIFSMLFGAGILIFISRLEKRTEGLVPAELFFRRQLWLLVFGLFNAFALLWFWDILYHYALCGMLLFAFRRLPPRRLLLAAGICILIMTVKENMYLYADKLVVTRGELVAAIDTTRVKLTDKQKGQLSEMEEMKEASKLESRKKKAEKIIEQNLGTYSEIYDNRASRAAQGETMGMYYFLIWDILLFMFIGMAFFKLGILQGEAKTKVYLWMAIIGLGVGLPLSWFYLQPFMENHFNNFEILKHKNVEFYELQRLVHSIGIFGLIMLLYKSNGFKWLFALMRPVGQMAFTNYLMQSLMCGLFFYGVGFGYFGKLQRYELFYVVGVVWIVEIIWSHLWLRYFRFGPLEWAWRSLTYWKKQPLKKNNGVTDTMGLA